MKKILLSVLLMGIGLVAQAQLQGGIVYRINGANAGSGTSRTFATLRDAAAYVNLNGLSGSGKTVLEFSSGYTSEDFTSGNGIVINALANASASLGLTIRPATGITVNMTASLDGKPIIDLDNADYITIDGRPGGVGTTNAFTLENNSSSNTSQTSVVRMINDAQFNNLSYLNIKLTGTATSYTIASVIIGTSVGGTTGNTYNTINNNTFGSASTYVSNTPQATRIASAGTAARPNSFTSIFDNLFESWGGAGAIYSISGNNWQVTNNHFYAAQAITSYPTSNTSGIYLSGGEGRHNIEGNFFGGQTINAGGARMQINAQGVNFIYVSALLTTAKTVIKNNTITNFRIDNLSSSGPSSNVFISALGSQIFDLLDNTIGSLTTPSSIILNLSGNSGSTHAFQMLSNNAGGDNIKNNVVANLETSSSFGSLSMTMVNVGGNPGKTIEGNTFRKIKVSGNYSNVSFIYANSANVEILNNTLGSQNSTADIEFATNRLGTFYMIRCDGNVPTKINGNQIGGLSVKTTLATTGISTVYGISATGSTTAGTLKTVENNIVGGSISDNMQTIPGAGIAQAKINYYGIYTNGANTLNNTVRNITNNEHGEISGIYDLTITGGLVDNNTIEQLTVNGQSDAGSLSGIFSSGSAPVSTNTISGLKSSNAIALSNAALKHVMGIYASGSMLNINRIFNLEATGAGATSVFGIVTGAAGILKNRIYDLWSSNATAGASIGGMALASTSDAGFTLANNVINVNHNGDIPVYGILAEYTGGATDLAAPIEAYYNTIFLEGTASGTALSSAVYRTSESPLELKNNLLFNNRSGGTGAHSLYGTTNGAAAWSSDYNFLATTNGNSIVGYWSGVNQDFATWKSSHSGQDVNSINDMTLFPSAFFNTTSASTDFLRTTTTGKLKVAKKAISNVVIDDILGTVRTTTPTIGAFEEVGVLPVTFNGFTAKLNGNKVNLNWNVSSEVEILRYEIERLTNGTDFVKVAAVSAGQLSTYTAVDANPQLGSNYYRLSAIDNDGTLSYFTEIREVKVASLNEGSVSIYPNPLVGSVINVTMAAYSAGTYQYKISDITGKLLQSGSFDHKGGGNTITISAVMPKGVYVLQISKGKEQIQAKLIKP